MKKNIFFVLIALAFILAVVILLLLTKNNSNKVPSANINRDFFTTPSWLSTTKSTLTGAQFSGTTSTEINSLPILNTTFTPIDNFYPILDNYCQITSVNSTYHLGQICNYYTYDESYPIISATTQNNQEQSADIAQIKQTGINFINTVYTAQPHSLILQDYSFIYNSDSDYETDSSNLKQKDIVATKLFFTPNFENIPILERSAVISRISLTLNNNLQVATASLTSNLLNVVPQEKRFSLLNMEEAISNINKGRVFISYVENANSLTVKTIDISKLTNINLTTVKIEYRLNESQNLAIPCYHFSGTGFDAHNNKVDLEVVTPAINFTIAPSTQ